MLIRVNDPPARARAPPGGTPPDVQKGEFASLLQKATGKDNGNLGSGMGDEVE